MKYLFFLEKEIFFFSYASSIFTESLRMMMRKTKNKSKVNIVSVLCVS